MKIEIPEFALVMLIGPSGAGKSTFAAEHFLDTEVISSDECRGIVSDDPNSMDATSDAFDLVHFIAEKRLQRRKLVVIDATNVQKRARRPLVALAKKYHALPVAIVLDMPERLCRDRNEQRDDRNFGGHVITRQRRDLRKSRGGLRKEGIKIVYDFSSPEEIEELRVDCRPLWCDNRDEQGPFDIIGDVHGCCDELEALLEHLGYEAEPYEAEAYRTYEEVWRHPEGRRVLFVGDLTDRGPRVLESVDLARNMIDAGAALCAPGNHENKLGRKLRGSNPKLQHGFAQTVDELDALPEEHRDTYEEELERWIRELPSHLVLDNGRLVVAHAGLKENMHNRASGKVRSFALYGETTGERDEYGLPIRLDWASDYKGDAMVVYGHTPVPRTEWLNKTVNVDTGCVFGGELTALRYPEKRFESVEAARVYCEPIKPIEENSRAAKMSAQHLSDDMLDLEDVTGKLILDTRLKPGITVREHHTAAALETMSRFATHPKWLIHLPPTMSPAHSSEREGYLESPREAFAYYSGRDIHRVVCEEKHMGSRAIAIVCRDEDAVRERFGLESEGLGVIYTRTGRPFFQDESREAGLIQRLRDTLSSTGFWEDFDTNWVCLDTELMPWSEKAQALLEQQYAKVGSAAEAATGRALELAKRANSRGVDMQEVVDAFSQRRSDIDGYRDAYREYCWPVDSLDDIEIAPFHVLGVEGQAFVDKSHVWHMETIEKYLETGDSPSTRKTRYRVVDLRDDDQVDEAEAWWDELTSVGGEGMVVKPMDYIAYGNRGLAQPAIKVRGREYLRIIYGPEYTRPDNLERLRKRNVGKKRSLARREFALGVEALERFVRREPLRRVHECVFGVLALESEPVNPTL